MSVDPRGADAFGEPTAYPPGPQGSDGPEMSTEIGLGSRLSNPLMTASGCAANGKELHRFGDIAGLGAFVTKSVKRDPQSGRGTPRMAETPSGMLNSIGLQGPGIDAFVQHDLPWLRSVGATAVVSIAGASSGEFAEVAQRLVAAPDFAAVRAIEVNISCPNVANRGLVFACDPDSSIEVLRLVAAEVPADVPLLAKLTPDVTDIAAIAGAALAGGAHALTMINTLLGIRIDTERMRPHLFGTTGGLSGPAIRPVAVRAIWQVHGAMRAGRIPVAPIIGVGGVRSGQDALELTLAGASAIQVGTAIFNDPQAPWRVLRELTDILAARGIARYADLVGAAHQS